MAANVSVRNLDDAVAAGLRRRAARHGRSTEAEIRDILARAVRVDRDVDWRSLALRVQSLSPSLDQDVTTAMIRDDRDSR